MSKVKNVGEVAIWLKSYLALQPGEHMCGAVEMQQHYENLKAAGRLPSYLTQDLGKVHPAQYREALSNLPEHFELEQGKESHARYKVKSSPAPSGATIVAGFAASCQRIVEEIGINNIISIDYKDNWMDTPTPSEQARGLMRESSYLIPIFEQVLGVAREGVVENSDSSNQGSRLSTGSHKEKQLVVRCVLQSLAQATPKVVRLACRDTEFREHCERLERKISSDVEFSYGKLEQDQFEIIRHKGFWARINSNLHQVIGSLALNYDKLTSIAQGVRAKSKGETQVPSFEVRSNRLWASFPAMVVNGSVAIVGFYPAHTGSNQVPALIIRSDMQPELFAMVVDDFEATWAISVTHISADPTRGYQGVTSPYAHAEKAYERFHLMDSIQKSIHNLVDNHGRSITRKVSEPNVPGS